MCLDNRKFSNDPKNVHLIWKLYLDKGGIPNRNGNLKWHLPLSFGPLQCNVYMQWGKGMDGKIVPLRGVEAGGEGVRSLIANAILNVHFSC